MKTNLKLIGAAMIAVMTVPAVVPTAANAQSAAELRRDKRDIREEKRDVRQAKRYGDRRDVRDEKRDVREARQEYREDWRDYRNKNRNIYRGGKFNAPFRYRSFNTGVRIDRSYYGSRYYVSNYSRYRLPAPGRYQQYVRHYNDVLLVDTRRGTVVRVYRGLYW